MPLAAAAAAVVELPVAVVSEALTAAVAAALRLLFLQRLVYLEQSPGPRLLLAAPQPQLLHQHCHH
jgi:hypothetical protein